MRARLSPIRTAAALFAREHLRTPLTLTLLVVLPPTFVIASASVLSTFAVALGGSVAGRQAPALGAGWSVAFLAGAVGYFQTSSSRSADRRLAAAGLGALRTAVARLLSTLFIAFVLTVVAVLALRVRQPLPHLAHTMLALFAFGVIYLGIGAAVGVLVGDQLAGSLAVAFVFILDVFSGPGMAPPTRGLATLLNPSRSPAELIMRASLAQPSPTHDWFDAGLSVAISVTLALGIFWLSARRRT